MKIVYLLLVLVPLFSCKVHRQNRNYSNEIVKNIPLGDSVIHLVKGDGIKDNYLLMNVHENEQTAIHAMVRGSMKIVYLTYTCITRGKEGSSLARAIPHIVLIQIEFLRLTDVLKP